MKRRLSVFWSCLLLLLCVPQAGSSLEHPLLQSLDEDVRTRFVMKNTGGMHFLYHEVDATMAGRLIATLAGSRQRLAEELDIRDLPRTHIVIAYDRDHFYSMSGGATPHWAGAVTLASRRLIVFRSQRWGDVGQDLGSTMRHELAHLGLGVLHKSNQVPTWMEEGIAVVLSGMPRGLASDNSTMSLSKALSTGSLMRLSDLESLHGFAGNQVSLAYMQSESAVRFFLERHGRVALIQILSKVGRGEDFGAAFDAATGGGWYRFEEEWREWLKDRRGLYFLVDIDAWIWGLILLLAFIAFGVRRLRARRILRRWEAEEQQQLSAENDESVKREN